MITDQVRTERSYGMQGHLDAGQRASLLQVRNMPGYEVLLDLIEKLCIEQETKLINTETTAERDIIAEHRMAKAFWQIFAGLQKQVNREINLHMQELQSVVENAAARANYDEDQTLLRP